MMNVDAEFIISQTASVFMNTTFGWPDWTVPPTFPVAVPHIHCRRRACG